MLNEPPVSWSAIEVATEPILNVVGSLVALGPLRRDLVPLYLRWINDFEVARTLAIGPHPVTLEAEEKWYERASTGPDITFTIYERSNLRPIGNADLRQVSQQHRTADFGILIGEKDCWGKGYGTEATRLMLDYAFTALGLHNVMLQVYDYNERGIRAYTRAGFKVIGRRRAARRVAGEGHDVIMMDCLATEFESPALRWLLVPPAPNRSS